MKTSSDFQTGGVLLLTATVICGALAVTVVAPLMQRKSHAATPQKVETTSTKAKPAKQETADRFSEFYPSLDDAKKTLAHFDAVAGPIRPAITERRIAHDSESAGYLAAQRQVNARVTSTVVATPFRELPKPLPVRTPLPPVSEYEPEANHRTLTAVHGAAQQTAQAAQTYTPSQIPSGTVYAPVTVNFDGSAIAEQIRDISVRIDRTEEQRQKVALAEQVAQEKLVAEKRQRNRKQRDTRKLPDEQIVRLEASLQKLATSFEQFQNQTQSGLEQLTKQADRAEVAVQVMDSYERMMEKQQEQITKLQTPAAPQLPAPTRVAELPSAAYSDTDAVPLPVEPGNRQQPRVFTNESSLKFTSEPVPEPSPIEADQFLPAPTGDSVMFPPQTIVLPPSSDTTHLISSDSSSEVLIEEHRITLPAADAAVAQQPEVAVSPEPSVLTEEELPAWPIRAAVVLPTPTPTPLAPVPVAQLSAVPRAEVVDAAIQEPAAPSISFSAPPLPVGFENVYRFKLADVEPNAEVVPGDGPVCQHCGRIHVPGESHTHHSVASNSQTAKLTQTSATSQPSAGSVNPAIRTTEAKVTQKKNMNRSAGRGSNRHVLKARGSSDDRAVWDLATPSRNASPRSSSRKPGRGGDSPNPLQRMGSTLMRLTR